MKINSNTVYPYPIWGWKDDYKVGNPEYRPIEDSDFSDKDNYIYELKLTSIHPDIQKLIDEKKAINACVIDCPSTFYHSFERTYEQTIIIIVPRNEVNKRFEVKWMILSTEEIDSYQSQDLNEDYGGNSFFPLGAMIAYVTSFEVNTEVCDTPHSIDDIFAVVKNPGKSEIEYQFEKPKIRILLPEPQLETYKLSAYKYPHVILSSIVYRALVMAISKLRNYDDELDWVYIIKQYIDTMEIDGVSSSDDNDYQFSLDECFRIADEILKHPFINLFEEISPKE